MDIISFLLWLILLAVVFGLIWWLLDYLPLPAPIMQIVRVIFIVILIILLLSILFGGVNLPSLRIGK